jgi:AI-2 transport system ATP-binding protein
VLSGPLAHYTDSEIVAAMTRSTHAVAAPAPVGRSGTEEMRLQLNDLCGEGFRRISFAIRAGEIVGLAGVVGAGRTELAETIFGLRPMHGGAVALDGTELSQPSPRRCIDRGLVYLPEDRQRHGLFLDAPLYWNVSSYIMHRQPFMLRPAHERQMFREFRQAMGIKCEGSGQSAGRLSGGNQQKVLLAKCLAAKPRVLILDEPTRGVDVAARNDIYAIIRHLARDGVAVLLISSDFDEVVQLADRILVMAFGSLAGELPGGSPVEVIGQLAFGVQEASHV